MKIATFDLEIFNDLPEGAEYTDQGISVAAIATGDETGLDAVHYFQSNEKPMGVAQSSGMIMRLSEFYRQGYTLVTWNGCSFDWRVLGIESGNMALARALCLNHVDLMLNIFMRKGFPLALNTALVGMGIPGKVHDVTLKDGTPLTDMSGGKAPALWRAGEYEAVKTYLKGDVVQLLALANDVIKMHNIQWTSKSGKPMYEPMQMWTVEETLSWPAPNTSWMTNPLPRSKFIGWLNA